MVHIRSLLLVGLIFSVSASVGAQIRGGAETAQFEPGDHVLYQEDLSGTPIGAQVEGWEITQGSYEVAEFQGKRWFRPLEHDTRLLRTLTFPQDFSVELTNYEKRISEPVAFETAALEEANARFREKVTAILNRVARAHGLGGVENNWVMVSPIGVMQSPVALLQGRSKLTRAELAAGQDLALVHFNLPEGSEVPSGFYVMHLRQENGRWIASLKDLAGKMVLERAAEVGPPAASLQEWAGRRTGIYDLYGRPVYGVRFGVELAAGSFYMVIQLGTGRVVPAQHSDSRAIEEALAAFRRTVRSVFAPWLKDGNDVFIATRSDALVAAVFDPNTNNLVSYLRASRWPGGLYRIRDGQIESAQPGAQRLAGTFQRVAVARSMNVGIVGGISGSTATLGYIGPEIEPFLFEVSIH